MSKETWKKKKTNRGSGWLLIGRPSTPRMTAICLRPKFVKGCPRKHPWRSCWVRGTSRPRSCPLWYPENNCRIGLKAEIEREKKLVKIVVIKQKNIFKNYLVHISHPGAIPSGWSTPRGTCSRVMNMRLNHPTKFSSRIRPRTFPGSGSSPVGSRISCPFRYSTVMTSNGFGGTATTKCEMQCQVSFFKL